MIAEDAKARELVQRAGRPVIADFIRFPLLVPVTQCCAHHIG